MPNGQLEQPFVATLGGPRGHGAGELRGSAIGKCNAMIG